MLGRICGTEECLVWYLYVSVHMPVTSVSSAVTRYCTVPLPHWCHDVCALLYIVTVAVNIYYAETA